jgi:hypothetical protein
MNCYIIWIAAFLGLVAICLTFCKMKKGFGPYNIRALGIVLVATFATLLGLQDDKALTAAMGILGAIGGYIFGIRTSPKSDQKEEDEPAIPN